MSLLEVVSCNLQGARVLTNFLSRVQVCLPSRRNQNVSDRRRLYPIQHG